MGSHPLFDFSQRERHGGIGDGPSVQTGRYTEHKNNCRNSEHLTLTNGKNWCNSNPASSWFLCDKRFGNMVILYIFAYLYPAPTSCLHIGASILTHFFAAVKTGKKRAKNIKCSSIISTVMIFVSFRLCVVLTYAVRFCQLCSTLHSTMRYS